MEENTKIEENLEPGAIELDESGRGIRTLEDGSKVYIPFYFVQQSDPNHLIAILSQEHPQTVAMVLAYLQPDKVSRIVPRLPKEIQFEVIRRISLMGYIAPEMVREVERSLESRLSQAFIVESYSAPGGIEATVEILSCLDNDFRKDFLEHVADDDPKLAEELEKRLFVFEDILMFDKKTLSLILNEVDLSELAKALKSTDHEVHQKVYESLPKDRIDSLKSIMVEIGPVRIKESEAGQDYVVSIIRDLEKKNKIIIPSPGDDFVGDEPFEDEVENKEDLQRDLKVEIYGSPDADTEMLGYKLVEVLRYYRRESFRRTFVVSLIGLDKTIKKRLLMSLDLFATLKVNFDSWKELNKNQIILDTDIIKARKEVVEKFKKYKNLFTEERK